MRIAEVESYPVRVPAASPPFVWRDGLLDSQEAIYSSTVVPALNSGKTLTDTLDTWQTAITNKAKSLGYTVN